VEAFVDALHLIGSEGLLVVTRWLGTPPSESARTWATLIEAMKQAGFSQLEDSLIAYRGMRTATIIASSRPFTFEEIDQVRGFLKANAFDPIMLPNLSQSEINIHNRLPEPAYHQLFAAILSDPDLAIGDYEFNLQPATDNRPFFFHYFRWRQTPEVLQRLGSIWQPFGGSGYFVLLALLGLVGGIAIVILVIPVVFFKRVMRGSAPALVPTVFFAALGSGFMLIEIPLIQGLGLLFDQPTISLAVVLFGLLLFSGLGSYFSERLSLRVGLTLLVIWIGISIAGLPAATRLALSWDLMPRLLVALVFLAPLGFLMGIPFASGLRIMGAATTAWAWAVNGAFSGIAGVLAAVISLDWGFTATLIAGLSSYLIAWVISPRLSRSV
jgi:hypothetical protein